MAELMGVYSALKYAVEKNITNPVILTDSLRSVQMLKNRLENSETCRIIHEISQLLISTRHENSNTCIVWIPAHSGIKGNEEADRLAKTALDFQIGRTAVYNKDDIKNLIDNDYRAWIKRDWPFFPEARTQQTYFKYITNKTDRPWFKGFDLPRRAINLVTRLRTGHVCVGEFFLRLGWNISPECRCGFSPGSVKHYITNCPLLSEGRDKFTQFYRGRFRSNNICIPQWNLLLYKPDLESVVEINNLLYHEDIIIILNVTLGK